VPSPERAATRPGVGLFFVRRAHLDRAGQPFQSPSLGDSKRLQSAAFTCGRNRALPDYCFKRSAGRYHRGLRERSSLGGQARVAGGVRLPPVRNAPTLRIMWDRFLRPRRALTPRPHRANSSGAGKNKSPAHGRFWSPHIRATAEFGYRGAIGVPARQTLTPRRPAANFIHTHGEAPATGPA
jgi:hypothetical protein